MALPFECSQAQIPCGRCSALGLPESATNERIEEPGILVLIALLDLQWHGSLTLLVGPTRRCAADAGSKRGGRRTPRAAPRLSEPAHVRGRSLDLTAWTIFTSGHISIADRFTLDRGRCLHVGCPHRPRLLRLSLPDRRGRVMVPRTYCDGGECPCAHRHRLRSPLHRERPLERLDASRADRLHTRATRSRRSLRGDAMARTFGPGNHPRRSRQTVPIPSE